MGNVLGLLHNRHQGRIRLSINDLSNGRTHNIVINEPSKYTFSMLSDDIRAKLENKNKRFLLKRKSTVLPVEGEPNALVTDSLGISENGSNETTSIMLEYIDNSVQLSNTNNWTLHIKTLTGNVITVETSNPQEICVLGLKLLIHQEETSLKPDQMRLVISGKELEDGKPDAPTLLTTASPDIINGSTIQLVLK